MTVLRDLDAFYLDHRRCGELRAGVDEREPIVWIECECRAVIARRLPSDEGPEQLRRSPLR